MAAACDRRCYRRLGSSHCRVERMAAGGGTGPHGERRAFASPCVLVVGGIAAGRRGRVLGNNRLVGVLGLLDQVVAIIPGLQSFSEVGSDHARCRLWLHPGFDRLN